MTARVATSQTTSTLLFCSLFNKKAQSSATQRKDLGLFRHKPTLLSTDHHDECSNSEQWWSRSAISHQRSQQAGHFYIQNWWSLVQGSEPGCRVYLQGEISRVWRCLSAEPTLNEHDRNFGECELGLVHPCASNNEAGPTKHDSRVLWLHMGTTEGHRGPSWSGPL